MKSIYLFSEFLSWKEKIEKINNVSFVTDTGAKTQGGGKIEVVYYRCSRGGYYKDKCNKINDMRQRKIKLQGSSKINNYCTASMVWKKFLDKSIISVIYCKSHYGHEVI